MILQDLTPYHYYQDFLAGIKQNLYPIEKMRNCIAHNRSFTDKIINNYVKVKKILEDKIDDFWDGIQNKY